MILLTFRPREPRNFPAGYRNAHPFLAWQRPRTHLLCDRKFGQPTAGTFQRLHLMLPSIVGQSIRPLVHFSHMQNSQHDLVFKVVTSDQWEAARKSGVFRGAPVDIEDGYIHFSTEQQVRETVAKHFAGQTDLILVAVETAAIENSLKWETSRGGALFPHLYDDLHVSAVVWEESLPLVGTEHQFPSQMERQ